MLWIEVSRKEQQCREFVLNLLSSSLVIPSIDIFGEYDFRALIYIVVKESLNN